MSILADNSPYRTDKFKVGDQVTWANEHYATVTAGRAKRGDGPFTITQVFELVESIGEEGGGQSTWESTGHTQHIVIGPSPTHDLFSGVFFKLITSE